MKITRIEPIAVRLPMTRPMKMAGVEIRTADNLLVRIDADNGLTGWGEAASAPTMTGEFVEGMVAAVRYLAPTLTGANFEDLARIAMQLDRSLHGNASAKAAIDMALHDLLGKTLGQPVYALLGGQKRQRIPALWMLGTGNADNDVAEARAKVAQGFVAFKIKVGVDDPLADAERTRRICAAIGPGKLISADANQGWSIGQAMAYLGAIGDARLDFLEQPIPAGDMAGLARIAASTRVAIGVDESIHEIADITQHHQSGAAKGCSLKAIKLGGVRIVFQAAQLCETAGMKVNLACKVAESSIATAAVLHLAVSIPSIDWGVSLSSQYLADDIVRKPLAILHGHATVPEGNGLGIEVDDAKIARYRYTGADWAR